MPLPALLLALLAPTDAGEPASPIAWPAGPLEVRIAYGEPVDGAVAADLAGRSIPYGLPVRLDDRYGPAVGVPRDRVASLTIAGARLEDGGRTLVLLTDPHPTEASYAPDLPSGFGRPGYDLSGVEASWTAEGASEPEWSGWLPELDLGRARDRVAASVELTRAFERFERPGALTLRTLLELPEGTVRVAVEADRPVEAELAYLPMEPAEGGDGRRVAGVTESFGEAVELYLTMATGGPPPSLAVTAGLDGEEAGPIGRDRQVLPWAPPVAVAAGEPSPMPGELAGGDPERGEAVFFAETSKCAACHRVGKRGERVGPVLTDVADRLDAAAIYESINAPSARIAPEYLPYAVADRDGRVYVGVVRAEGPEAIRLVNADAEAAVIPRDQVAEIRPGATSIMPVGLAGALGERDLRDLMAYLLERRSAGDRDDAAADGAP